MGFKSSILRPFAAITVQRVRSEATRAIWEQEKVFKKLIRKGLTTQFGIDHNFLEIKGHRDFCIRVPIRTYEDHRPYIDQVVGGKKNVLWPGKPRYLAKTSGTTSGAKYIPLTQDSVPHHVASARNSLFMHFIETGSGKYFDGKMLYLSGSPQMQRVHGIDTGRLSGIVNHQIPNWIKGNKLPSHKVNCIEHWEDKVKAIVQESMLQDVRLVGGIPPWVQMYYELLLDQTGKKTVIDVFPNLSVFVYGGVNYEPYRAKLESLMGASLDSIETYPASEGFIAYQDKFPSQGLLLNIAAGMFFEFVPVEEIHGDHPTRLTLAEVELGVNYALIISSNAGLWAYNIGDTIQFVSTDPYRIVVTGRIKHFISAFGEHVIGKEVDQAMQEALLQTGSSIIEFSVAPQVNPTSGLPYHEWLIEFASHPTSLDEFARVLNESMVRQNIYYKDLIDGKVLRPAIVTPLAKNAFRTYMDTQGKLGGQNKVPRLANDRKMADQLPRLGEQKDTH